MTEPMNAEAVAQMVADMQAGTPGPWTQEVDEDTFEPRVYGDNSLVAICGNHMTLKDAEWIPEADGRRIARVPEMEQTILALQAKLARTETERDYDRRQTAHLQTVVDKLNAQLAASEAARMADEARVVELEAAAKPFEFASKNAHKIKLRPHDFVTTGEFHALAAALKGAKP